MFGLCHWSISLGFFFFFFCIPQQDLWGSPFLGEIFCICDCFLIHHWGHILSLWMVHAVCVFVASICPSRTWMSGSFESMGWNACVPRLDLHLYYHLKEFWGNGFRTHVNSKGKNILYRKNPPQRRIKPTMLHQAGQRAKHTTNWAILACFSRHSGFLHEFIS